MVIRQILLVCLGVVACFQGLGQELSFEQVEKLPSAINTAAEEAMPLLSPDGQTLYFTRLMYENNVGGKYAGQDVWVSKFDGTNWSKPDNSNHLFNKNKNNSAVIGISGDGKILYLLNALPNRKLKGIYFSKNINGSWADPELIPIEGVDNEGFVGFYVSPDFEIILISMKGADSKGEEDLYVCVKNSAGRWSKPKNLGPTVNTAGFEISPFLSADKKRLYFSSNGHKGMGDADIFYSERLYDSWEAWSAPKNLGEEINSKYFDGYFSMYGDTLTYFTSNRDFRLSNIYKAKASFNRLVGDGPLLSKEEMKALFGVNFSSLLSFTGTSAEITAAQKELLWYIGGKLVGKSDIRIILEAPANHDKAIIQKRISAIIAQLAFSGLEGSRILQTDDPQHNSSLNQNEINLIFVH